MNSPFPEFRKSKAAQCDISESDAKLGARALAPSPARSKAASAFSAFGEEEEGGFAAARGKTH